MKPAPAQHHTQLRSIFVNLHATNNTQCPVFSYAYTPDCSLLRSCEQ
ncbi:MAG: hypothetical protein QM726_06680 [Chitinophagaceae bacterium]